MSVERINEYLENETENVNANANHIKNVNLEHEEDLIVFDNVKMSYNT